MYVQNMYTSTYESRVLCRNFCLGGSSGENTARDATVDGGGRGPKVLLWKILNFRSPEMQFKVA